MTTRATARPARSQALEHLHLTFPRFLWSTLVSGQVNLSLWLDSYRLKTAGAISLTATQGRCTIADHRIKHWRHYG
jgi:hypothetical protein